MEQQYSRLPKLVQFTLNYADFEPDYWGVRPLHCPVVEILGLETLARNEFGAYELVILTYFRRHIVCFSFMELLRKSTAIFKSLIARL